MMLRDNDFVFIEIIVYCKRTKIIRLLISPKVSAFCLLTTYRNICDDRICVPTYSYLPTGHNRIFSKRKSEFSVTKRSTHGSNKRRKSDHSGT